MRRLTARLTRRRKHTPPGKVEFPILLAADETVGEADREHARAALERAARHAYRPVVQGRVTIRKLRDPDIEQPAVVKASQNLGGPPVRAHAEAAMVREAIDRVEDRLRRNLDDLESARRRKRRAQPG
jgi:ribosome-associated translation inhibitor RaiA